ncbi:MAG: hypothetical protein AAGA23_19390 [Pseudomonadota bacterium]
MVRKKTKTPEGDNVEQIREIIFGGHIKDYEKRFAALEKKLEQSQQRLSDHVEQQVTRLGEKLESLGEQLSDESLARRDALESMDGLLQNQASEAGQQLAGLETQLQSQVNELEKLLGQWQEASQQELKAQADDFQTALAALSDKLSAFATGRSELAGLLSDLATRLEAPPKSGNRSKRR